MGGQDMAKPGKPECTSRWNADALLLGTRFGCASARDQGNHLIEAQVETHWPPVPEALRTLMPYFLS